MVFLPTRGVPGAVFDIARRPRLPRWIAQRSFLGAEPRQAARHIPALGGKAHYDDPHLASEATADVAAYRRRALAFVSILESALAAAGRSWSDVGACLDIGCSYGRIVRELCGELSPASICVCDVDDEAAWFTATEFGVRIAPPIETIGSSLDAHFDLVYLLSVYTDLSRAEIEANLAKVATLTKPGGVVVFTTNGKPTADVFDRRRVSRRDRGRLTVAFDQAGFCHLPPKPSGGGSTWIAPAEVGRLVAKVAPCLTCVAHGDRAVDGEQDVFVYRKDGGSLRLAGETGDM